MSAERASLPAGGKTRAKSYGSLVNSSVSPLRQRRLEHQVQPGETLQGLALKYGVSMEQIKRANRLYTNDSIFLKKSLWIPVLTDFHSFDNGVSQEGMGLFDTDKEQEDSGENSEPVTNKDKGQADEEQGPTDLSPMDFLKRMDGLISQSKLAAVKKIQEGGKGFTCAEEFGPHNTSSQKPVNYRGPASCSVNQRPLLGAVPLTITKRTKKLRDREDEIFE
ncbi:lysM and putative peptidoglycan-binding domain-containing protein 1, partial [Scleropages formosus]